MRWSRYSSRYFISRNPTAVSEARATGYASAGGNSPRALPFLREACRCARLRRIHAANGKANVDHHIVAQSGLRDKAERYWRTIPPNCTRAARKAQFLNLEDFTGYGRHMATLSALVQQEQCTAICDLRHARP